MGIISRLFGGGTQAVSRDFTNDRYFTSAPVLTASGEVLTDDVALQVGAVFASVRVIAESLASLSPIVYERTPEGGRRRAEGHYLTRLLSGQVNEYQTSYEFIEMMTGHAVLRGNAYAEIVPGPNGFADKLYPLDPDKMTVERLASGRLRYSYQTPSGQTKVYTQDQIFHLRGLSGNGVTGHSVLKLARESFGLARATERYGASQFGKRPMPAGILTTEKTLTPEAASRVGQSFRAAHSGPANHHSVAVLEEGMTWQEIGMTSADAQFMESRKFQIEEIARWFRVPPHMIGDLDRATFSNIEHQSIEFVTHTITPWAKRWEQAILRDLVLDQDTYYVEFLLESLLRGDTASRYSAYSIGVQNGWLTRNEVRERENLEPLDGLDKPLTPLNLGTTGAETEPADADEDQEARTLLDPHLASIVQESAARLVRREYGSIAKWAPRLEGQDWSDWLEKTYSSQAVIIQESLCLSAEKTATYIEAAKSQLLKCGASGAISLINSDHWMDDKITHLFGLAIGVKSND